jgi:HD-GYP domain-containing protein (c-di-GMP phosphodiesterase class II)
MMPLRIEHPVFTLEGKLLAEAGTVVTGETLKALRNPRRDFNDETRHLFRHGTIREDLLGLLVKPPYSRIFPDRSHVEELLQDMETIELLVPILETMDYFKEKDFYTYRHVLMVFALSTLLAKDMVPDYRKRLRFDATGPIHDIGKICVPIQVLRKSSPITRKELSLLHHHTAAGYILLCYYLGDSLSLACRVARDHHERRDGSGYPRGIPLGDPMVEIIAACDVYDALIAPRPYRRVSYDNRTALEELTSMAEGGQLGWDAVKALVVHNRKSSPDSRDKSISLEKRGKPPQGNIYGVIVEDSESGAENLSGKETH